MKFTLMSLLIAVTVMAAVCAVFFALPALIAVCVLALVWIVTPPAIVAGIVYGRGYGRAFAIGCVATGGCLPFAYLYFMFAGVVSMVEELSSVATDSETVTSFKIMSAVAFGLTLVSGLTSVMVRWLSNRMAAKADGKVASQFQQPSTLLQGRVTTTEWSTEPIVPPELSILDSLSARG